jgi:hypothetical protein
VLARPDAAPFDRLRAVNNDGGDSMRTFRQLLAGFLVLALTASSAGAGQRHVVPPSTLAGAVADHARQQDAQRAEIRSALSRPEVQSVASSLGLSAAQMSHGVNTLDADTLNRAGTLAHDVNQALTGGASSVTISVTTIIIILLLVILIVVIAD